MKKMITNIYGKFITDWSWYDEDGNRVMSMTIYNGNITEKQRQILKLIEELHFQH